MSKNREVKHAFKTGSKTEVNTYQFLKNPRKPVVASLTNFLKQKNILHVHQCSFRPKLLYVLSAQSLTL